MLEGTMVYKRCTRVYQGGILGILGVLKDAGGY